MGTKYEPLAAHLNTHTLATVTMRFLEIEKVLGFKLPRSANRPQFWANTEGRGNPLREAVRTTQYESFLLSGSTKVEFRRWTR